MPPKTGEQSGGLDGGMPVSNGSLLAPPVTLVVIRYNERPLPMSQAPDPFPVRKVAEGNWQVLITEQVSFATAQSNSDTNR